MIVGENNREQDLPGQRLPSKKLTNIRVTARDDNVSLACRASWRWRRRSSTSTTSCSR